MAVVSDDHANPNLCVEHLAVPTQTSENQRPVPRLISPDELNEHSQHDTGQFWAVIDRFVVDATELADTHPGGLRKLLSTNNAEAGVTGRPFVFSFSRGRNAHFPGTGRCFQEGVQRYLATESDGPFLHPVEVQFPSHGKIVILGQLHEIAA
jgi:hypothetical protein